jgi:hypothetical protein
MRRRARAAIAALMSAFVVGGSGAVAAAGVSGPALIHPPIIVVGANQSSNWSGYNQGSLEQEGNPMFHSVSATWRVPKAKQHKAGEAEYSSTWIGIGGGCVDANCQITDSTLIQAGTEQDVDASGAASYSAWYEFIPEPATPIPSLTIHAGDRMYVSIAETSSGSEMWDFTVSDVTTGETFTLNAQPYTSSYLTVEWIEETPVVIDDNGNVTIGPLPKLSRAHFNLAMWNGAGANLQASEELELVDPNTGQVLARPSAPDSQADGFNVCVFKKKCKAPK